MPSKCSHPSCSKRAYYGTAGSKKAEMCPEHALDGMVNVVNKRCSHPTCSKQPSYGMAGSQKAEMCSEHALDGMVNLKHKKCSHTTCSKQPSYGMAGSKKAEMCSEHALDGMVDVINKRCSHPTCSKQPSYGMAGSMKVETCLEHALDGMVNVTRRRSRPGSADGHEPGGGGSNDHMRSGERGRSRQSPTTRIETYAQSRNTGRKQSRNVASAAQGLDSIDADARTQGVESEIGAVKVEVSVDADQLTWVGSKADGAVLSHPGAPVKTEEAVKITLSRKLDAKPAGVEPTHKRARR